MSRTSMRLNVFLFLALLVIAAVTLNAAPAPSSTAAFLGKLTGESPCQAQIDASVDPAALQGNAPIYQVIYPNCGINCSDTACSGAGSGDTCYVGSQQGTCTPHNTFCSGEIQRSPCTCENLCVPPGGTDDVLYNTDCCSGQAVPGSTWCNNPADYGTTWASCYQICA